MTARSITDSILNCEIAASLAFLFRPLHSCAKTTRQGVVYTLNLFQLFNQSPVSKYPLPLAEPNCLSRRTVTNTRTDGHTRPLQIIMHLLISLEQFENFLWKNEQFLTRIIDYNILGGIANLLLSSRAAPAFLLELQVTMVNLGIAVFTCGHIYDSSGVHRELSDHPPFTFIFY